MASALAAPSINATPPIPWSVSGSATSNPIYLKGKSNGQGCMFVSPFVIGCKAVCRCARSDAGDHSFASAHAVIVSFCGGIDFYIDKHPVNPAFQNSWCAEPPKREMYNKQVAALYVVSLCTNFGCQRGFFSLVTLFGLRMKKLLVFSHIVMMAALNSIKPVLTKVKKS